MASSENGNTSSSRIILKILLIIFLAGLLYLFSWLESNVETLASWSRWFFGFGVASMICIVASSVFQITRREDDIEIFRTTVAEKGGIFDKIRNDNLRKYVKTAVYIILIVFVSIFAYVRAKHGLQVIDAPEYTSIAFGPFTIDGAILSGCAGLIENFGMFSVIPDLFGFTLFFFLSYWLINGGIDIKKLPKKTDATAKIPYIIGILMFFVVGTSAWVLYHWGRYGLTDMEGSLSVAGFAFINLCWVWLLKDIVVPGCYHFFNNVGKRLKDVPVDYWKVLINPLTIAFIAVIIIFLYLRWRFRKKSLRPRG